MKPSYFGPESHGEGLSHQERGIPMWVTSRPESFLGTIFLNSVELKNLRIHVIYQLGNSKLRAIHFCPELPTCNLCSHGHSVLLQSLWWCPRPWTATALDPGKSNVSYVHLSTPGLFSFKAIWLNDFQNFSSDQNLSCCNEWTWLALTPLSCLCSKNFLLFLEPTISPK